MYLVLLVSIKRDSSCAPGENVSTSNFCKSDVFECVRDAYVIITLMSGGVGGFKRDTA